MKLIWGPHTCAIGTHVLLEEIGRPYETERIDVQGGGVDAPEFRTINPKGKVPVLIRDDGRVLTEFGAIAGWLARTHLEAGLLPVDPDEEARARSVMDYVVGTVHGQGFARVFLPARFEPQDPVHQSLGLGTGSVKRQGREMIEEGFAILDDDMAGRDFVAGDRFGVADAALFYAERWAPEIDLALPPRIAAHLERMRGRPAVQRVMRIWNES